MSNDRLLSFQRKVQTKEDVHVYLDKHPLTNSPSIAIRGRHKTVRLLCAHVGPRLTEDAYDHRPDRAIFAGLGEPPVVFVKKNKSLIDEVTDRITFKSSLF